MPELPDVEAVIATMRSVAAAEIVPRFQRLAAHEVSEKSGPRDLVTIADIESERRLEAELTALVPGSVVVGEEGCEVDASRITALASDAPVWLIDPVDGTNNFVKGKPCFAVIVAFCLGGLTRSGWILDPLADTVVWAVEHQGAWRSTTDGTTTQLTIAGAGKPVAKMSGSLGWKLARQLRDRSAAGGGPAPERIVRLGCTGREYMDLVTGQLDFVTYTRLKPWDHAAGLMIHAEAGGYARMVDDGRAYRPEPRIIPDTVLAAPDADDWRTIAANLDEARRVPTLPL